MEQLLCASNIKCTFFVWGRWTSPQCANKASRQWLRKKSIVVIDTECFISFRLQQQQCTMYAMWISLDGAIFSSCFSIWSVVVFFFNVLQIVNVIVSIKLVWCIANYVFVLDSFSIQRAADIKRMTCGISGRLKKISILWITQLK